MIYLKITQKITSELRSDENGQITVKVPKINSQNKLYLTFREQWGRLDTTEDKYILSIFRDDKEIVTKEFKSRRDARKKALKIVKNKRADRWIVRKGLQTVESMKVEV